MRGPRRHEDDLDVLTPRRLPSGRWVGCRHWLPGRIVGFDPRTQRYVPHEHDHEESE